MIDHDKIETFCEHAFYGENMRWVGFTRDEAEALINVVYSDEESRKFALELFDMYLDANDYYSHMEKANDIIDGLRK